MDQNKHLEKIFLLLKDILKHAYCPYSHFKCAAICQVKEKLFYGVNVENASYPVGVCAEKVAISNAIAHGFFDINYLYLLTDKDYCTPCGNCRQFISEFFKTKDQLVYTFAQNGTFKTYHVFDLLPAFFSKNDMVKN